MDLKAILEANKSKVGKIQPTRKPVVIATDDRPYSIVDNVSIKSIDDTKQKSSEPPKKDLDPTLPSSEINSTLTQIESLIKQNSLSKVNPELNKDSSDVETKNELKADKSLTSESNLSDALISSIQTEDKGETNIRQTRDKVKTNIGQEHSDPETKLRQTRDKVEPQPRTSSRVSSETNLRQSGDKLKTSKLFAKLVGLQRSIILFIYDECQSVLDVETAPLSIEHLSKACGSTVSSVRKTVQRMIKNNVLIRSDFKDGRGGWTKYRLPDDVYQEILFINSSQKLKTNLGQSGDKVESQLRTQLGTNLLSSSSFLNIKDIKDTTTALSDEWNFDISAYAKFGFTKSQIKQIASVGVISASDVEQSLIEFSYDLDNDALPKIKTNKINFLMGLLRSGTSYVSEGFRNEQDAMILEMAKRAEGKSKKLLEEKFIAWEAALSDEERKIITSKLPTHLTVLQHAHGVNNPEIKSWLFNYFLGQ